MKPLNQKQQQILAFLQERAQDGLPPTVREICAHTGIKSDLYRPCVFAAFWRRKDISTVKVALTGRYGFLAKMLPGFLCWGK